MFAAHPLCKGCELSCADMEESGELGKFKKIQVGFIDFADLLALGKREEIRS